MWLIFKTSLPSSSGTRRIQGCGTKVFYILIVILVILLACVVILGIMISKRQTCNNDQKCIQRCYVFSDERKNWTDAKHACEKDNFHLVVINSKQEQDVFVNMNTLNYWIGLTDQEEEGTWQWVDGTSYKDGVKFWHKDNPSDSHKNEDCAELHHDDDKTLWNDNDCTKKQKWICEKSDC
ncbi:hepatic lectin-like isoform X2 [Protopterus annectens]|uniref:hepatic lectin-like isoform X2 n=1 Tax=Protopterus annectens TaxID=7888 RepID=UPI001CF9EED7|nr:hepatic lectin-like isoform X2 [Protopterus annectens]